MRLRTKFTVAVPIRRTYTPVMPVATAADRVQYRAEHASRTATNIRTSVSDPTEHAASVIE